LLKEPHEHTNLAGENPKVVARLAKKIAQWYPVPERNVITVFD